MTEDQLEIFRLHARVTLLETIAHQMLIVVAKAQSPDHPETWVEQAMGSWASRAAAVQVLGVTDPAYSDLMAGEFQEQVARFAQQLLELLRREKQEKTGG